MKSLLDECVNYCKTDEAKRHMKDSIISPIGKIIYQELYLYVWLICFYHIFLVFLILCIIIMLLRQYRMTSIAFLSK